MPVEDDEDPDRQGGGRNDPGQGAIRAFARALRELRAEAGSPSYRRMAGAAHFSSSALAAATAGRRLPSEAVTRAFAEACGADPDEWARALDRARRAVGDPPRQVEPAPVGEPPHRPRRRSRTALISVLSMGVGAGAAAIAIAATDAPNTVPPAAPALIAVVRPAPSTTAASDGVDPVAARCTPDAVMVDKTPVLVSGVQVAALELKYSRHCGAGWARLYLYPGQPTMLGSVLVRADDGRAAEFTDPLVHQVPIYTDVIVLGPGGCLGAQGTVVEVGKPPVTVAIVCQAPS